MNTPDATIPPTSQSPGQVGQPPKKKPQNPKEQELIFNAWKAIIEVQMHFNDILMRIRNLAVTLILAVFGAAAFSLQYELYFQMYSIRLHIAALIIVFGLCGWSAMGFIDRYYHKLLVGAVNKSTEIENTYDEDWLGLTNAITRESRTVFGKAGAMKARKQVLLFLYAPILAIGLLYILAVAFLFQPSYEREGTKGGVGKTESAPVAPRVAPTQRPSAKLPKGTPEGDPPVRRPATDN